MVGTRANTWNIPRSEWTVKGLTHFIFESTTCNERLHVSENAQAVEPTYPTRKQALLAAALINPDHKTLAAAAKAAGMDRTHAGQIQRNPAVMAEIERLKREQRDKARGFKPKAERLLHRALDRADNLDPLEQSQIAGSTLKLVHDLGESEAAPDLEAFKQWKRRFALKCYAVGYRAGQKALDMGLSPAVSDAQDPAPSLTVR